MALSIGKVIRFFTVRATEVAIVLILIIFMPNIPPNAKIKDPITITPSQPLEGKLALNTKLNDVMIWHKSDVFGPEAFAEHNGVLYASVHNGEVVKFVDDAVVPVVRLGKPCKGFHEERICGRPLGMEFDKDGGLIVADAYYGIFRVNVKTGAKMQLISVDEEIDGAKPMLPNSVAVAANGDIFWSDSSTEFMLQDGLFDMFADGSGRLIHYDAKTKKNTVLLKNLLFANGVALSDDEEFVIISETGRSCVHRYYLKGRKKGTSDIFIDGLPGLPDNINSDGQGGFFLPLILPKDQYMPMPTQVLAGFPLLRKLVARLMGLGELGFTLANRVYHIELFDKAIHLIGHFSLASFVVPNRVTIVHVSKEGEIIGSYHANNRKAISISEAFIFKDELYLGSPFNDYIARIPLRKLDLEHLSRKRQIRDIPTTTATPTTPKIKEAPTTVKPRTTSTTETKPKVTTAAPTTQSKATTTTSAPPTKAATTTPKPQVEATTVRPTINAEPIKNTPTTAAPKQETAKTAS